MRASRAYIAGFGTTSVLVASALLLLAVVSTLVAFKGWPDTGITEGVGSLMVDEPERVAVDGPAQVALNAAPAAAAVALSPAPGTAAAGPGPTGAGAAGARRNLNFGVPLGLDPDDAANLPGGGVLRDDPGDNSPPSNSLLDEPTGGLLPQTPVSPQVNQLTEGLGNTTQGLTDGLGTTVGRLNPQLGQTVTETGRVLSELVRGLGRPPR